MCFRVQSCCCGCTLRCGAITAAIITFLSALFVLAGGILCLLGAEELKKEGDKTKTEEENKETITALQIVGGIWIAAGVFTFIVFICLAVGINKSRSRCLSPWLVVFMLGIVANVINIITMVVKGNYGVLGILIGLALEFYLWIVVYSYYKELQENEDAHAVA